VAACLDPRSPRRRRRSCARCAALFFVTKEEWPLVAMEAALDRKDDLSSGCRVGALELSAALALSSPETALWRLLLPRRRRLLAAKDVFEAAAAKRGISAAATKAAKDDDCLLVIKVADDLLRTAATASTFTIYYNLEKGKPLRSTEATNDRFASVRGLEALFQATDHMSNDLFAATLALALTPLVAWARTTTDDLAPALKCACRAAGSPVDDYDDPGPFLNTHKIETPRQALLALAFAAPILAFTLRDDAILAKATRAADLALPLVTTAVFTLNNAIPKNDDILGKAAICAAITGLLAHFKPLTLHLRNIDLLSSLAVAAPPVAPSHPNGAQSRPCGPTEDDLNRKLLRERLGGLRRLL